MGLCAGVVVRDGADGMISGENLSGLGVGVSSFEF
jgi:hypothetical protein